MRQNQVKRPKMQSIPGLGENNGEFKKPQHKSQKAFDSAKSSVSQKHREKGANRQTLSLKSAAQEHIKDGSSSEEDDFDEDSGKSGVDLSKSIAERRQKRDLAE